MKARAASGRSCHSTGPSSSAAWSTTPITSPSSVCTSTWPKVTICSLCALWAISSPRLAEPAWRRQVLRLQELRIEQLRLIARSAIREDGDDGVPRPELAGKPDRAGDVDAGRAAQHQALVLDHVEDDRQGLLVGDAV